MKFPVSKFRDKKTNQPTPKPTNKTQTKQTKTKQTKTNQNQPTKKNKTQQQQQQKGKLQDACFEPGFSSILCLKMSDHFTELSYLTHL